MNRSKFLLPFLAILALVGFLTSAGLLWILIRENQLLYAEAQAERQWAEQRLAEAQQEAQDAQDRLQAAEKQPPPPPPPPVLVVEKKPPPPPRPEPVVPPEPSDLVAVLNAHNDWLAGDGAGARARLLGVPFEQRSWLWHYKYRLHDTRSSDHDDGATALAVGRTGTWVASGGGDGIIRVRDAKSQQPIHVLRPQFGPVHSLAGSADGLWLASGHPGVVALWSVRTGERTRVLKGLGSQTWCGGLSFSEDDRLLVGDGAAELLVWEVRTGNLKHHIRRPVGLDPTTGLFLSGRFVTGTWRHQAGLSGPNWTAIDLPVWDVGRETLAPSPAWATSPEALLPGHLGGAVAIARSGDAKRLATADAAGTVRVWELPTPLSEDGPGWSGLTPLHSLAVLLNVPPVAIPPAALIAFRRPTATRLVPLVTRDFAQTATSLAFAPDGTTLAMGLGDRIDLLDSRTMATRATLKGAYTRVNVLAFAPDGRLWSADAGGVVRHWDVAAALRPAEPLARRGLDGKIVLATPRPQQTPRVLFGDSFLTRFAFSPNGRNVAGCSFTGTRLADVATEKTLWSDTLPATDLCFDTAGERIAVVGSGDQIRLLDAATGKPLAEWKDPEAQLLRCQFHPNGQILAVGSGKGVRLWDIGQRKVIHTFPAAGNVVGLSFARDGSRLAVGTGSGNRDIRIDMRFVAGGTEARVWDMATREAITHIATPPGEITDATLSPDGTRLFLAVGASNVIGFQTNLIVQQIRGSLDGQVIAYDVKTGTRLTNWRKTPPAPVLGVSLSPCGRYVLTSNSGGLGAGGLRQHADVTLWSMAGEEAKSFPLPVFDGTMAAISPDNRCLAVISAIGLQLWDGSDGPVEVRHEVGAEPEVALWPDGRFALAGNKVPPRIYSAGGVFVPLRQGSPHRLLTMNTTGIASLDVDGGVVLHDARTGLVQGRFQLDKGEAIASLAFLGSERLGVLSHDGKVQSHFRRLVVAHGKGLVPEADLQTVAEPPMAVGRFLSADGRSAVLVSRTGVVERLDLQDKAKAQRWTCRDWQTDGNVRLSADGRWLTVSAAGVQKVRVYELGQEQNPRAALDLGVGVRGTHDATVGGSWLAVAYRPRDLFGNLGNVSGQEPGMTVLYDLPSGREVFRHPHTGRLTFQADAKRLAITSAEKTVVLDLANGRVPLARAK